MRQGIILAAGLGTRLREITVNTPKSLIKVNNQAILERNIEFMYEAGIERIIVVVGYKKDRFKYLLDKYKDFDFKLIFNEQYDSSNTVSSLSCVKDYLNCETYITTADIYLKENPYIKYKNDNCFYLLRPYSKFDKADWIAKLSSDLKFIDVDKKAYEGYSYTGISHWTIAGLNIIKKELNMVNWESQIDRNKYWDELFLKYLPKFDLYAEILDETSEIYEFDDLSDLENLKLKESLNILY